MKSKFKVPLEKDSLFYQDFFMLMSNSMQELLIDYQKWPDEIQFSGRLGKELNDIIIEKEWDFSKFNIKCLPISSLNKIIFKYSKPLTVSDFKTEDGSITHINADSLNQKTINGIPGSETMNKIILNSIGKGFNIEKTVRPEIEILLIR
jgi:hypothetical protein